MSIEFKLPELGENVESGDVVKLLVREGEVIEGNQSVVELETDKAVVELPCPQSGKIVKIHVKPGDTVNVGQTLLTVEPEAGSAAGETAQESVSVPDEPTPTSPAAVAPAASSVSPGLPPVAPPSTGPIPAGPAARRVAREMGIDIRGVQGSGTRGRITPDDVRASAAPGSSVGTRAAAGQVAMEPVTPPGEPGRDSWGPTRAERMSKIRRTIAAQMARSAGTIPHVTNFDDADVTDLEQLRKSVPKGFLGDGIKLTSMPFLMKAVALALTRHPMLNATIDDENEQVVYKEYVNLGVAVDTPRGLVVPAMRGVDRMTIPEIARSLVSIAERARAFQFGIEDLRGGTFTISNLGAVGGAYSTPIINHPEVALLLVGRSRWMPVVRDGQVVPRMMMPLSLSYDHRLIDGGTAARFLNEVIDYLQSPGKLLLAGQ
jgi:pyruvate dehydrogenase E2 component (dihydrolipoamide acetyltransferase)